MPEAILPKISDLTRCPLYATASNRFSVELPTGGTASITPEQLQVAATLRVAEALEALVALGPVAATAQGELRGVLLAMSHLTPADVTPAFSDKLRALYLQKGGQAHG